MSPRIRTSHTEATHIITELKKLIKSAPEEQRDLSMYQAFSKACLTHKETIEIIDKVKQTLDWAKVNDAVLVSPRVWFRMVSYGADALLRNKKLVSYFAFLKEEELHKFFQDSRFHEMYILSVTEIDWNDKKIKFYDFNFDFGETNKGDGGI